MDADTLINDGFIEDGIDDESSDDVTTLVERTIRDYWEGQIMFDPADLAEIIIETIMSSGYDITETLAD